MRDAGVLEEANLRPCWIEESEDIRMEIQRFRDHPFVTKDKQTIRYQVDALNKRIATLNLVVPLLQFQVPYLKLRREMQRWQAI